MIVILLTSFALACTAEASEPPPEILRIALQHELDIVATDREKYYLIVDLFSGVIHLKAGGRTLLTTPIEGASTSLDQPVARADFERSIPPHSALQAFKSSRRLADRRLPLDFVGRLIEGPRKSDRLYFPPSLLIESGLANALPEIMHVKVSGQDLKSISSAMKLGLPAILIQPVAP